MIIIGGGGDVCACYYYYFDREGVEQGKGSEEAGRGGGRGKIIG